MNNLNRKIIKIVKSNFKNSQKNLLIKLNNTLKKTEKTGEADFEISHHFKDYYDENMDDMLCLDVAVIYRLLFKREFNLEINKKQFVNLVRFFKSEKSGRYLKILALIESLNEEPEVYDFSEDENLNKTKCEKKETPHMYL